MAESLHALLPLGVLLASGVLSASLLPRLGIPTILSYLIAGILIGPSVTGLVPMTETVQLLAEFGVIFLLFDIGLHFSLKQLWANRRDFLALGPLQWISTTVAFGGVLWAVGLPLRVAALVAGALALSSTAVALQTLHDRGERGTPLAQSATALLIFQDVVAIVLLAIVGAETGESAGGAAGLLWVLGKAVLAIAAVALLGRLLRPAFAWITGAELDEAFTAFSLLVVVVTAGLTGLAGLSLPLGAFLGGMLLSESEYCYMIKTELKPFRGLLLGLFFITVGMELDVSVVVAALTVTIGLAVGLVFSKALFVGLAALTCGERPGFAVRLGVSLAQGSEFAFVIFGLLVATGGLANTTSSILTAAIVLTMALTPAIAPLGDRIGASLERRSLGEPSEPPVKSCRVLINGASDSELTVANALSATGHAYLVVDPDRAAVAGARTRGFTAGIGDLSDPKLAESLAESVDVIILGKTTPEAMVEVVRRLRKHLPRLTVIARVVSEADAAPLRELGAVVHVLQQDPDDRTLAAETLRFLGESESDIDRWVGQIDADPEWEPVDKAHAA